MTARKIQILFAIGWIAASPFVSEVSSEETITGLQVVEKVFNRPEGADVQADLTMALINSRGDQRVREIKQFTKDFDKMEKK
ncbi:MAG: hypothetical protein KAR36_03010, partial [Candidatus Latescibacteria bacterium]|nr:hypothetical protein [Candidatus Latescibacterota bacterium]